PSPISWYEKSGTVRRGGDRMSSQQPSAMEIESKVEEQSFRTVRSVPGLGTNTKGNKRREIPTDLPIVKYRDAIKASLQRNNVLILIGETGSGKSTQIGQILVGESWNKPFRRQPPGASKIGRITDCSDNEDYDEWYGFDGDKHTSSSQSSVSTISGSHPKSIDAVIGITQPRRIAATSLAKRVSTEMGTQ